MLAFFLREINWQHVVATKWGHLGMSYYYDLVSGFSHINIIQFKILFVFLYFDRNIFDTKTESSNCSSFVIFSMRRGRRPKSFQKSCSKADSKKAVLYLRTKLTLVMSWLVFCRLLRRVICDRVFHLPYVTSSTF